MLHAGVCEAPFRKEEKQCEIEIKGPEYGLKLKEKLKFLKQEKNWGKKEIKFHSFGVIFTLLKS